MFENNYEAIIQMMEQLKLVIISGTKNTCIYA